MHDGRTLLTGATGYVGGRLLSRLEDSGRLMRCLTWQPAALRGRAGDTTGDFKTQDREAATHFADAAQAAGVRRIIYLGGRGNTDEAQHNPETQRWAAPC